MKLRNLFAAFVGVAALGLTIAANAGAFEPTACLKAAEIESVQYLYDVTTSLPTPGDVADDYLQNPTGADIVSNPTSGGCEGDDKFCCVIINDANDQVISAFDRD